MWHRIDDPDHPPPKDGTRWLPIETAPQDGRSWLVSNTGIVTADGKVLNQYLSSKGYKKVTLGRKSVFVHRLVALAFIPPVPGKKEVNHKNGVKTDNSLDNLEWCSRSENMTHAYAAGLHPGVKLYGEKSPNWRRNGDKHPQSMPVLAIFPDGTTKQYRSQGLAAADGFLPPKISLCVNGLRKTHGGVRWQPLPPAEDTP